MFIQKKFTLLTIVALCLLTSTSPASGQTGADVPSQVLQRAHDVDRLMDGHTLITDGGEAGGPTAAQPGSGSQVIEVDEAGNVVWLFNQGLNWAHNADRLPSGNTLISDTGHDRVIEIDAAGSIVWDSDDVTFSDGSVLDYPNDANWLSDDHLLITDRDNHRVIEIARDGAIVWQFGETGAPGSDDSHLNGPHNADRLSSGNTIVADSINNRIVELAPDGSIAWQYPLPHDGRRSLTEPLSPRSETFGDQEYSPAPLHLRTSALPLLDWPRDADRLSNGNTLITDSRHDRIIEVTPTGQVVWEYGYRLDLELPYDADRLANGNTLISGSPSGGIVEVDLAGDIVWQYPPAPTSILASIVMHNEEPLSGRYPDFVNDEPAFWQHRAALVQFVNMLHDNGVMFNYQSDWNFLMAAGMYDTGTTETNGKNIIRYIKDLGFEVDPHAHETQYNYADVAYLIEMLGVTPSHTAGGFLAAPPEDSKLEYLWQPITATLIPTYTWQAEILWGGATSLHQNEEALWVSGVWKPKDNEHFLEHDADANAYSDADANAYSDADANAYSDADAPLPHVGGYGRDCERLVQKQQNGELEEGKIHTCTIFVGQNKPLQPGFILGFEQQIQTLDAAGDVRWMGLAQVIDAWQTDYDSEPNIVPYLTPTPTPTPTPQPHIYLPLILKSYRPPLVTPTPTPTVTPTLEPGACDAITLVDNSLYYEGSDDECWHKEDLPSPQPWFEETIPPDVGSTTTPLYFGIGVHIEPKAEYMDDVTYQQDRERLRGLAEIVAEHGGVLTIQTQTPFDDKAEELGDTIFADLAAQGHEIALHFHEDAHIPDADNRPVEEWVTILGEEIALIEELSGTEVRTWSGGNIYDHLYEAAEQVELEVNMNYKNPETQQSDERYTILTPWRPAGGTSVEERTTHDPDGAVIYIPSGVFPAHCDKLEAFPRPYCHEAFDYVTVALGNSLDAVTEGKINTFYGTLHPSDFFGPGTDEEKLQVWDEWLTTVVDPLVADGRIQWATMSDIADAFIAWEESCGE